MSSGEIYSYVIMYSTELNIILTFFKLKFSFVSGVRMPSECISDDICEVFSDLSINLEECLLLIGPLPDIC